MGPIALIYSIFVYLVFFASFLYMIAFVGGDSLSFLGAPKTIDAGASVIAAAPAAAINIFLLVLFGAQHSIMARPGFKKFWTRIVPQPMERTTYVLASVLVLWILFAGWRPMPQTIWLVESSLWAGLLTALFFAGFGIVLLSTFLINHFELFGLQQAWMKFKNKEDPGAKFVMPLLYKIVRHPLYLGFLIAFWATPHMTAGHLLFAGIWTAYILIGINYEERDLASHLGAPYEEYLKKVPMILPFGARK